MSTPPVLTVEQDTEARMLYALNYSLREIAQLYGCSKQAVARAIRRAGGTIRTRGNPDTLAQYQP